MYLRFHYPQQVRKVVSMAEFSPLYSLGDMVVHRHYGVGQIERIERKPLNGVDVECFKVNTENGIFWFPTDSLDNPRVHPVASQELIQRAIEILQSAPDGLENDPLQWKERIDDVQADGDFLAICGLVRDLTALKTMKKLNRTQDQALNNLQDRLLREWAASLEVDAETILPMIQAYLHEGNARFHNAP
jgi:RNA polymerase-interacting CarD/CdnL/TRCF family regulator